MNDQPIRPARHHRDIRGSFGSLKRGDVLKVRLEVSFRQVRPGKLHGLGMSFTVDFSSLLHHLDLFLALHQPQRLDEGVQRFYFACW